MDLFEAIESGALERLHMRLREGADPDVPDMRGITPLHRAVMNRHYAAAGVLLAFGADPVVPDPKGHTALSNTYVDLQGLHRIRQHYIRTKVDASVSDAELDGCSRSALESLEARGIVHWPGFVAPAELACLKEEFMGFIRALDVRLADGTAGKRDYDEEEHFWSGERAYICNNAFKYSRTLLDVACSSKLTRLVECYYGRPVHLQRAMAYRYLPEGTAGGMFHPHHDMQDKLFKIKILLTDIGETDPYMVYKEGTHKTLRPCSNFNSNELDLAAEKGRAVRALGKAGDAYIFDANGAHYANRTPGAPLRDVYILEYTADPGEITGGTLPEDFVAGLPRRAHHPLGLMSRTVPRWAVPFVRKRPSWMETLRFPGLWLNRPPVV